MAEQMMHTPDVSVVIPCYNSENWIGRAIDSALAQQGVTVDVIVIDDGSSDGSLGVIRSYGKRIRWETGPNRGACAARNRGLSLAHADYVIFLDADDYLEGPLLRTAVTFMSAQRAELAFAALKTHYSGRDSMFFPSTSSLREISISFLTEGFVTPCSTVWLTKFIRQVGGWRDNLRRYQDYEVVFRALSHQPKIALITKGNGVSFQHDNEARISSRRDLKTLKEQAEVLREIGSRLKTIFPADASIQEALVERGYIFWRNACRYGNHEAESVGKALFIEFGGNGHRGSPLHRIVASLIGLRWKEVLSIALFRLRKRLLLFR